MNIPLEIRQGDSTSWIDYSTTDNLGNEILPATWVLKYAIRGASDLDLTATVVDGNWKTAITKVQSSALNTGKHYWQAFAESGSERLTLGQGGITVSADLSQVSGTYDGRSQTRIDLEAVQATIRSIIAGGAVAEYTIANRSLRKLDMSSLIMLEMKLKQELVSEERAQKIAQGLGDPKNLYVRFKK